MRIEAADIVALKAIKELLERRISDNEKIIEIIRYEKEAPYGCFDDYRIDELNESNRLIEVYSEKLKMVEEQIEKKLIAIH